MCFVQQCENCSSSEQCAQWGTDLFFEFVIILTFAPIKTKKNIYSFKLIEKIGCFYLILLDCSILLLGKIICHELNSLREDTAWCFLEPLFILMQATYCDVMKTT